MKEGASRNVLRGIIQYDTLNEVNIRLSDGSRAFNYTGYDNIVFKVLKADGTTYIDSEGEKVVATSPADGIVTIILSGQATTAAGLCQSVIEIYAKGEKMTTARLNYEVFGALEVDEDAVMSEPEYPILTGMISEVSKIAGTEAERAAAEAARVARDEADAVCVNWSTGRSFVKGNKAVYAGSTYLCLKDCRGVPPTNTEYWLMIASKGANGAQGNNGVVLSVEAGAYAFEIDNAGHLILVYEDGTTPPDMELGDDGHLYINLE